MSRIAYIISAYKDAPHLSRLIKALDEDADFYVHIDRKADSRPFKELLPEGKVTFVQSHWVSWGGWEQVEYQKELLAAVLHSGIGYTRIVCLSGQDYPLWPNRKIHRYFEEHRDTEFIMGMNLTRSADKRQIAKIVYYHFFRDLKWENLWLKNKFIVASRHLMKWLPIRKAPIVRIGNKESAARIIGVSPCLAHNMFMKNFVPKKSWYVISKQVSCPANCAYRRLYSILPLPPAHYPLKEDIQDSLP